MNTPYELVELHWVRLGNLPRTIRARVRFRSAIELTAEIRYKGKGPGTDPASWTLAIDGYYGTRAELMATCYLDANRDGLISAMIAATMDEAANVDDEPPAGLFAGAGA